MENQHAPSQTANQRSRCASSAPNAWPKKPAHGSSSTCKPNSASTWLASTSARSKSANHKEPAMSQPFARASAMFILIAAAMATPNPAFHLASIPAYVSRGKGRGHRSACK